VKDDEKTMKRQQRGMEQRAPAGGSSNEERGLRLC